MAEHKSRDSEIKYAWWAPSWPDGEPVLSDASITNRNRRARRIITTFIRTISRTEEHEGTALLHENVQTTRAQDRLIYSQTWAGRYFNAIGYLFSVYCVWKIFISTINIVFDRVGKVDPITRTIDIAVHYMGFDLDVSAADWVVPSLVPFLWRIFSLESRKHGLLDNSLGSTTLSSGEILLAKHFLHSNRSDRRHINSWPVDHIDKGGCFIVFLQQQKWSCICSFSTPSAAVNHQTSSCYCWLKLW